MRSSRTGWKYLVDTLMFLCIVGVAGIGLMMAFFIPEGPSARGASKFFLGIHRHQWGNIHLYLSIAFTVLLVVHLVLSWSWIKGKAKNLFGKAWRAALGLTLLAAFLVPFLFWLAAPKNDPAYAELGAGVGLRWRQEAPLRAPVTPPLPESEEAAEAPREDVPAEVVITGQMTLRDIERSTGVPARDIAAKLELPPDVPLDEILGRLRRQYGFEIEQVRTIVAELLKN